MLKVSEARLNDLVYMALKRYFFEPMFGEGCCPRQCDIRVCMDMACPERVTSVMSAILLPNEVAPSSHERMYDVDPVRLFDQVAMYMEDHWMKQTVDEAFGKEGVRAEMQKEYIEEIVPVIMEVPEDRCAVTETMPPQ